MTFRDRVQAYKYESAAGGGSAGDEEPFPTVINVDQDALELAGLVFNDWNGGTPIHDQNVRILRIGDDLMFYDVAHSGGVSLSAMAGVPLASTAPADVTKAAAAVGVGTSAARADHKHDVTTAAAATVSTSSTDAEGAATSLARSDHVHQVTVTTGEISNTTSRTTTSTTAVLMTGMTVTPAAGTYLVIWSGSLTTAASTQNTTFSIYSAGALVTHSERICGGAQVVIMYIPFCCVAVVTVNGSQAIEGMWRTSSGTATSTRHSLQYLRIA
jgi:hypothetical protein